MPDHCQIWLLIEWNSHSQFMKACIYSMFMTLFTNKHTDSLILVYEQLYGDTLTVTRSITQLPWPVMKLSWKFESNFCYFFVPLALAQIQSLAALGKFNNLHVIARKHNFSNSLWTLDYQEHETDRRSFLLGTCKTWLKHIYAVIFRLWENESIQLWSSCKKDDFIWRIYLTRLTIANK